MIESNSTPNVREKFLALPALAEREAKVRLIELAQKNKLFFHDLAHTEGVVSRYNKIIDGFKTYDIDISPKEKTLGEVGAWFHDVVQDFEGDSKKDEFIFDGNVHDFELVRRKRKLGLNEEESAKEAIEFIEKHLLTDFSEAEKYLVMNQIMATVPKFDKEKVVIQENLKESSHPIDFALALADLGTSGMEPEKFVSDGDKLFMEDNLDILNAINSKEIISEARAEYFRTRMMGWCRNQVSFPLKRRKQVRLELAKIKFFADNPEKIDEFMRNIFPGFEKATSLVKARTENREGMSFIDLAKDMGYAI